MTGHCYVCAADDVSIEMHHIAPGWKLTVPLCVPCHHNQTFTQWSNRTLPVREDDPAQRLWAVVHGVLSLSIACAGSLPEVEALQLAHRVVLRMLCDLGGIDIGPNPLRVLG